MFIYMFVCIYVAASIKMKDRDVWMLEEVQRGSYFSHSEGPLSGLHYLSIKRLDELLFSKFRHYDEH